MLYILYSKLESAIKKNSSIRFNYLFMILRILQIYNLRSFSLST